MQKFKVNEQHKLQVCGVSGLIFLAALALCLWGSIWLARNLGNLVPNPAWRSGVKIGVFLVLLASPFVDEVIGKYQFEALCKANGIESADVSKARGKRVKLEYTERGLLEGTVMPISVDDVVGREAESGKALIQYKNYFAFGGWLMRYTPLSMGSQHPMLFAGNGCGLALKRRIFEANQISQIN